MPWRNTSLESMSGRPGRGAPYSTCRGLGWRVSTRDYGASYPKPGWVEQDLDTLLVKTMEACKATVRDSGIDPAQIRAVAFSTQRSVTCPVDQQGRSVRPMISWQDARTGVQVERMRALESSGRLLCRKRAAPRHHLDHHQAALDARPRAGAARAHPQILQNQDIVLKAFGSEGFHTDTSGHGLLRRVGTCGKWRGATVCSISSRCARTFSAPRHALWHPGRDPFLRPRPKGPASRWTPNPRWGWR